MSSRIWIPLYELASSKSNSQDWRLVWACRYKLFKLTSDSWNHKHGFKSWKPSIWMSNIWYDNSLAAISTEFNKFNFLQLIFSVLQITIRYPMFLTFLFRWEAKIHFQLIFTVDEFCENFSHTDFFAAEKKIIISLVYFWTRIFCLQVSVFLFYYTYRVIDVSKMHHI